MKPNRHNQISKQETDPRQYHLEGFRRTLMAIKQQKYMAAAALENTLNSHHSTPTRYEFADFAGSYAAKAEDRDEKMYASILASLPRFMDANRQRTSAEEYGMSLTYNERRKHARNSIAFTGSIREAIHANPRLPQEALATVVKGAAHHYQYSSEQISSLDHQLNQTLQGMKHELAFESILWNLPEGFEVIETTEEDDLQGIDYSVRCPNGTTVNVDVKSSPRAAEAAQTKRDQYFERIHQTAPATELILYSGFTNNDFDPTYPWRPTFEATERLVPSVEQRLRVASGEEVPDQVIANYTNI